MKIKEWKIPAAGLALIAAAAVFLSWWSANQRLGKPGIRVVSARGGEGALEIAFPDSVLDYEGKTLPVSEVEKNVLPPDTTISKHLYTAAADQFGVMLMGVLMGTDRTSIHQPEFCLRGMGCKIVKSELDDVVKVKGTKPYDLPVAVLRIEKEIEGRVYPGFYVYWFVADGLTTARHWERMWWMAKGLFATGELQRWAYVSCLALSRPGGEETSLNRVKEFLAHAVPKFQPRPKSLVEKEEERKAAAVAEE